VLAVLSIDRFKRAANVRVEAASLRSMLPSQGVNCQFDENTAAFWEPEETGRFRPAGASSAEKKCYVPLRAVDPARFVGATHGFMSGTSRPRRRWVVRCRSCATATSSRSTSTRAESMLLFGGTPWAAG
jgi:hypothetical protein